VFAIAYFATVKLTVAIVYRIALGTWPTFNSTPWVIMLVATAISTPVQAGEEIGWRGYALPHLSSRIGIPFASLVIGIVWAAWHLPFFFIAGADKSGQSFPLYLLGTTALSVTMAWLYWRTNGSLLLTMLMHAAVNNTNIVPTPTFASTNPFQARTSLVAWLSVTLLWIGAVYFLVQMRGAKLAGLSSD
jgi:membrane protease YdiL (CAAX protease family)